TGELRMTLAGHHAPVMAVAFSSDARTLASGSQGGTVRLWDPLTGKLRRLLLGRSGPVHALAFSPDGKVLASGTGEFARPEMSQVRQYRVQLWDPQTGELKRTLSGHSGPVWSVAFSPDGRLLASGSYDRTIRLWSVRTGELLHSLLGHQDA